MDLSGVFGDSNYLSLAILLYLSLAQRLKAQEAAVIERARARRAQVEGDVCGRRLPVLLQQRSNESTWACVYVVSARSMAITM